MLFWWVRPLCVRQSPAWSFSGCSSRMPRQWRWVLIRTDCYRDKKTGLGRFFLWSVSAGAEHHHGFAFDVDQALFFQGLEHAADHLAGTADDATDLLAGDLDLHAIGVGHGVRLLAQIQQGAGHTDRKSVV